MACETQVHHISSVWQVLKSKSFWCGLQLSLWMHGLFLSRWEQRFKGEGCAEWSELQSMKLPCASKQQQGSGESQGWKGVRPPPTWAELWDLKHTAALHRGIPHCSLSSLSPHSCGWFYLIPQWDWPPRLLQLGGPCGAASANSLTYSWLVIYSDPRGMYLREQLLAAHPIPCMNCTSLEHQMYTGAFVFLPYLNEASIHFLCLQPGRWGQHRSEISSPSGSWGKQLLAKFCAPLWQYLAAA